MSKIPSRLDELTPEQRRLLALRLKTRRAEPAPEAPADSALGGEFPVSFTQQRMWLLDRLEPANPAYNVPNARRFFSAVDDAVVERAVDEILRRHGALRTRFATRDGSPVQMVAPHAPFVLPVVDLSGRPEDGREAELERLAQAFALEPFNLEQGPLFRATMVRMGGEDWALLVTAHHAVTDGWSMGVFWSEFGTLTGAFGRGEPSPLPPLPLTFGEYARRQRERLSGTGLDSLTGHWKARLDGAPVLLDLPLDHPRPATPSGRGDVVDIELREGVPDAVQMLAAEEESTPFMVLLAAFQLLLSRYTRQTDLLVGTAVAGRTGAELERLIGFFANTLVLRGDLNGNPTFRQLVRRARETLLDAYQHQEMPFERLVEELNPDRAGGTPPLVQAMFVLQNTPVAGTGTAESAKPDTRMEKVRQDFAFAKFDLTLAVWHSGPAMTVRLEYAADLLDETTAERMLDHFEALLEAALGDPDLPVQRLRMAPGEELAELARWSTGPAAAETDIPVHVLFGRRAAESPRSAALSWADGAMTYGELDAAANRLAHHLRGRGVLPGARVGVFLERGPELVVTLLAILRAGAAYVPLDPAYPAERLAWLAGDAGLSATVTSSGLRDLLPATDAILVDLDAERDTIRTQAETDPEVHAGPDAAAYVIYTSGSTGRPKGVVVPHRGIVRLVRGGGFAELGPDTVFLQLAPSSFDAATLEIWGPLLNGGRLALAPAGTPEVAAIAAEVRREGVTHLWLTAGLFHLVADEDPAALTGVRHLMAGGDVLSVDHLRRVMDAVPSLRITNGYGPTENTTFTACHDVAPGDLARASVPIGHPIADTIVHVLDDRMQPCPPGVPGELYTGGSGLALGYLNRPGLTASSFVPDPFGAHGSRLYRTGDLVRWREGGVLEFFGRIDQQLKVRGFRIEPGEIEAALRDHAHVGDAVVVARADGPGEKRLVAYVTARNGVAPEPAALRDALSRRLPGHMVPSAWVLLDVLPLTPNGKVDRRALPAPTAGPEADAAFAAPRTPTEDVLAAIWAELLRLPRVGTEDDFFLLGGHSLVATQVLSRVRQAFGAEVPLRALFESSRLASFAERVDEAVRAESGIAARPLTPAAADDLPLSFAQERLWFIDRMEPGNPVYNMPFPVRMRGALDPGALARAMAALVERHAVLRTRFAVVDGLPVQRVEPADGFALAVEDAAPVAESDRDAVAAEQSAAWASLPFDLENGPLFRARLIRFAADDHLLLLAMHHAVSDGWSMGVFWREVIALYRGFVEGEDADLPPLPVQYADFAAWQREWLSGEVLERQVAWWREHLSGAPARLELPADRSRPPVQSHRGAALPFHIPSEVVEPVRALARREGATLFMALLAAWQVLLSRWSGQEDVVVGTPVAGRTRREVEGLIGFFVNTLAIRGDLSGAPSFRAHLARVREATLGAYAHQDLPFERLVEELQPGRSLSHAPIYQVMMVLQNTPDGAGEGFPGIAMAGAPGGGTVAKVDLTLGLVETGDGGLRGAIEYATDLFDGGTVERMAGHFANLLVAAASNADMAVTDLPLMSDEERLATAAMGAAISSFPVTETLHGAFAAQAARSPGAIAVTFGDEAVTYGALDARANRLAHHIRALGAGPDTLVGLCVERSVETVAGILAILKAGAAYLPLDPAYPEDRLAYMLEDSGVRLVVTTDALTERLPESATLVRMDADAAAIDAEPSTAPVETADPESLAYVIYTSGSTGRPKGVQVTHANVVRLFSATDEWFGFGPEDVWTLFHSYAFDFSVWELWGALLYGGRLVVVPFLVSREPDAFYALLEAEEVTVLNQTPSAFRQLMRADELASAAGNARTLALREVIFGGEALDPASLRGWVERRGVDRPRLVNMYGITETTVHVTWRVIGEADVHGGAASPIGIPIPDLSVHLLDRRGAPVPVGVVGEMYVGGAGVARGYLNRPALTSERFVPGAGGRLYRSGDLARRLVDGGLEFFGRADDQVKVRGFRIELGEIESVLLAHPYVREVVVLPRGSGDAERLVAWMVMASPMTDAELRIHLRGRLPEYMIPGAFVRMDALPLTRNGKVDRRALPEPDLSGRPGSAEARTPTEELLAAIWSDLLDVARVGPEDGFFELGGHSLLATRVVSRVREAFGVELPVRAVFEHANLAAQAAEIDRMARAVAGSEAPPIVPVPREGDLPLSFAQERMWFVDRLEPGSPVYHMPFQYLLHGALDRDALGRALDDVVRRHEPLRTRFPRVDGVPVQRVEAATPVPFPTEDLTGLPEAERGPEALRRARAESAAPFDLEQGPLFRASLVRLAEDEHLLLLTLHHVISDGWSMGVLWNELSSLYDAYSRNAPSPLTPLRIQYADFAHWQREWLSGPVLESQLGFWRNRLGGAPPLLALPTDRPRPLVQTHTGAAESVRLDREVADSVLALGRREGATLFMVLLAALDLVLGRLAGQDDVVVGTPIAGRTRGETEGLIGLFLNSLALRTDLSGNPSFGELLRRVREATLEAYAHQDVPFERVLEELRPERSLAHSPVFQVMLNLSNFAEGDVSLPGLQVRPIGTGGAPASKFDLTLYAGETPDGLSLHLVYNPDLFDAGRMKGVLAQIGSVLRQAANDPALPINAFSLVTEDGRPALPDPTLSLPVEEWTGAVHERFAARAAAAPDRVALVDAERRWTYGEVDADANRVANRLIADGVRPGDVVAVLGHRSAGLVRALLGVWKAGAAFMVLDPAYPAARLAAQSRIALPAAFVRIAAAGDVPDELAAALSETVRSHIVLGAAGLMDSDAPATAPGLSAGPDDLAYLAFTSGTTGAPKAVAGTHRPLSHFFGWYGREFATGAGDRFALLAGLAHDPLLRDLFAPLTCGGSLMIPDPARIGEPGWLAGWMRSSAVTVAHLTPAMAQLLAGGAGADELPALRLACFGGDLLSATDVQAVRAMAPGVEVVNLYGATETPQAMGLFRVPAAPIPGIQPVGQGIDGVQLLVLTPDGKPAGVGEVGEVVIRTPYLSAGYRNDAELTAERFVVNPWTGDPADRMYRTGDLGRHRPDGMVEIAGRADAQVKVRGFRVEPAEIVAALRTLPAVRDAVVGAHGTGTDRALAAWLVADGERPDAGALRGHLRALLPEWLIPSWFVWVDAIPLTPNGKVDRRALPAPDAAAPSAGSEPATDTERTLAEIWSTLLRRPDPRREDHFFSLGGHSLLATRVSARVRDAFGVELPLRAVFEHATLAALAAEIDRVRDAEPALAIPPIRPVPRGDTAPASFAQERMWFVDRMEPGGSVYLMPSVHRLRGAVDAEAMRAAVTEMVRRHETLRTAIPEVDGLPVQRILPAGPVDLPFHDLSGRAEPGRSEALSALAAENANSPFDMERGPLFRASLVRLGADDHVLMLNVHHAVSDGWSNRVLITEIAALHDAFRQGRPSPLAPLPVQYADYALWQREWMRGPVLDQQLAWWRETLAGAPPRLELPADRPRAAVQTHRGASAVATLEPALADSVRDLARREGATSFMVLLASFSLVLSRLSGQEDVVVGTPLAGRTRAELEGLIGLFLNSLALRTDLSGNPSFRELLGRVREATLGAYAHQDVPFERVLEEIRPERSLSHTPVFQVMLNLLNFGGGDAEAAGQPGDTAVTGLGAGAQLASKFDLTLYAAERPDGLAMHLVYNADLFDAPRMEALLAQVGGVLRQAVKDPARPLDGFLLRSDEDALPDPAEPLSDEWRGSVPALFAAQASRAPYQVAVEDPGERWMYGELDSATRRIAARLVSDGVRPGDVVAIWAHRSAALVRALMGTLRAGAAFVVLDPAYPATRLAEYVRLARPTALLRMAAAGPVPPVVEERLSATTRSHIMLGVRTGVSADEVDGLESVAAVAPEVEIGPDSLAYLSFTSGTTGTPRAVMGRHGSLTHFTPWLEEAFGLGAADRFSLLSGLAHDPLHRDVFTPLQLGAAIVAPDAERTGEPGYLATWMTETGITVAHLTPAMGQQLTEVQDSAARIPSLRLAFFVGDVLTRAEVARLHRLAPAVQVVNYYGSTETQRAVGYFPVPRDLESLGAEIIPVGRGIPDVQLLLRTASGAPAGIGELGEIWMRSPHVALGYRDEPVLTAERFVPNPWTNDPHDVLYRTGDLGRYRADGTVEIAGRADRQVKVRGFRVEPGEVEAAIRTHPAIRDTVVVARGGGDERRLVAYVVGSADENGVREHLRSRVPEFMIPADVVRLDALPVTPNGKVDRTALPEPAITATPVPEVTRSATETAVAEIWAEVLGREAGRIASDADFFTLGGHSLRATQVLSRIRSRLGVEVPIRAFFAAPTVAAMAAAVDAARPASAAPAVAAKDEEPAAVYPPGVYPLTFPQQRLWVLSQLGSTVPYNMPGVLRLVGPLDEWALERALDEVVRRHEPLRTRIERRGDEPVQVVQPPRPVRLRAEEVSPRDGERVEDVFRRMAEEEALRPFPAEGPYFRVRLVRAAEDDHLLLWTMHHVVSDGWSIGIFRGELATLYRAFAAGDGSPLPPLSLSYGEHAAEQRRVLAGEVMDRQVAWWADRLRGAPGLLELPTDYPRPATPSGEGSSVSFQIAGDAGARVGELAGRTGTTPFMVLLAAFQVLLARWSGQDDMVVGTPIANRTRPEVEGLIGFFANTLALRGDLSGDPPFTTLLARVREATLGAYGHQDVPFERVVEAAQPERTLSHNPLFQAMFTLVNTPPARTGEAAPGELAWVPLPRSRDTSLVDLSLTLAEQGGRLSGVMEFATDLFRAETVRRMAEHFAVLLDAALADPDSPVSGLSLATAEEAERLLALGDGGGALGAETVVGRFAAQAARRPDAVALVAEGVSFTYADLAARVERMAARLRAAGARPDRPVAVVAEHSAAAVVGMMGAMASGGAYLPVDAAHPAERIAYTLADSGATVVAVQAHLRDRLPPTDLPVLVIEEDAEDGGTGMLDLPDPDSAAYVLYTSGSTGAPKAVVVSHAAALANVDAVSARFGITAEDGVLGFSSLTFDPSVEQILIALLSGGRLVMRGSKLWTPAEFAARVAEEGITYLDLPTAYWNQLVDDSAALALVRRHVRLACIGGESMVTERARRWVQAPGTGVLVNGYGPTETVVTAALYTVPEGFGAEALPARTPVGTPPAGRTLRVLDARLRLLAEGVPGELYIGGPVGARGYLGRPALTAERFVPDPFGEPGSRMYRSGDLARWNGGELEFLGRADMQVKVRGFRVEPGEVESVLRTHPGVRDVAVAARPDAAGENRLIAYVAGEVDEAELRDLCASRLPVYMVPQVIVPVDALPVTRNGKVDYRALPDPGSGGAAGYLLPTGAAEVEMAALWADTLGVKCVGARDDFFRLGGHSLLAVRLLARVGERFGRDLPLATLFQNPTLSVFTAAVRDGAEAEDEGRLRVTLSGGTLPPFFCMPPAGGTVTPYTDLARLLGSDQPFHALQAPGVATEDEPLRSVQAMAERYVDEIRLAQPAGPYRLGGWSAGGLVALEVARRLRARGEEVSLLALFDTIPPDGLREAVAPDRVEQYVSFARNSVTNDEARLAELESELRAAGPAGWMKALSAWVARNGAQVLDAQLERLSRVFDVYEATAEATDAYRLADPYDGPVALFVAEEANPKDAHLPPLAERWKPFVAGSLRTWTIPGAHARMVYEPNVRVLADALREALRDG
ncbi:non-ribosomal peptide synthetase [Longimicrobium terrae]|uniref:Amino acid adenylation domain-containing protein n=1 Tax=Longimicrobium terrae TaxID=1639882 RepID=A0A841H2K8_9BACT|nr:non-ribosomal peptide synthetase [Longimicrobium terrae]MBB4637955.1 amino acid adenylation domain-containing protein [Longimicrobium terrae]MBB6072202.1 amino acid adenylation domain-containing protein [Longimicrobium terrae]NNC28372.1 non-ribosomal peptide synthase/polyketide synthase [Longimicrobium terrae]